MEKKQQHVEIRSDDFQEIVGRTPSWMLRYGITAITLTILVLLIGSYFFRYPDIINSRILIITENPPVSIIAQTNGKLQNLSVEDEEVVQRGQMLAFIESPANYHDIHKLNQLVVPFRNSRSLSIDSIASLLPDTILQLGEVNSAYQNLQSAIKEQSYFIEIAYHTKKIAALKEEVKQHKIHYNRVYRQRNLLEKEYRLAQTQFSRDSGLHAKGVISDLDFEKATSLIIQKNYDFEEARTKLSDSQIKISELDQEILDLELNYQEQKKQYEQEITESLDKLLAGLDDYELKHILKSPIEGKISFNKIWSNNQYVRADDKVFTIIPEEQISIIGKLDLPVKKSGKVKPGQHVNIKLDNYPHLEYGMIIGQVERISLVPDDNFYNLEVSFPNGLLTNYKRTLPFSQMMQGDAEIITEDVSLMSQIFNPFKSLIKKQQRQLME